MRTERSAYLARGDRVGVRAPRPSDRAEFAARIEESRAFHEPWVYHAAAAEDVLESMLERNRRAEFEIHLICRLEDGAIAGVVNLCEIVRGVFRSAYLGYYVFKGFERQGLMREGLLLVLRHASRTLELHRFEANVQPGNAASIALVRGLGFRREGFSPRYLNIGGRWRDHERWAILTEEIGENGEINRG